MPTARSETSREPTLAVVVGILILALVAAAGAAALLLRPAVSVQDRVLQEQTEEVRPGPGVSLDKARGIHVYLVPHPDDELSGWTSLTDAAGLYPVLVLLTRGGATTRCHPDRFERQLHRHLGEVAPDPQPSGAGSVRVCKEARLSSFRAVLSEAALSSPGVAGLGAADLVDLPAVEGAIYASTAHATLVVLDLPDGRLTSEAVKSATADVLDALAPQLGQLPLARVTASAYYTDPQTTAQGPCPRPGLCEGRGQPYPYPNSDHRAVQDGGRALAGRATEGAWLVTSPHNPAASVFRTLPQDVYDEFMGLGPGEAVRAQRLGSYQRHYGWLAFPGVWRRGDLPLASDRVIFSRVQTYEVVAP